MVLVNIKMKLLTLVSLVYAFYIAECKGEFVANNERIFGGTPTTIDQYPFAVSFQRLFVGGTFMHNCGGTILTTTSILSAAHCFTASGPIDNVNTWRARVGSSFANSGGSIYNISVFIIHPAYNPVTILSDVAVVRTSIPITYIPNAVAPGSIAGPAYVVEDNQPLWVIGWGVTDAGVLAEQLKHVQVLSVNQALCRSALAELGMNIVDRQLCSGLLGVAGVGQCSADSGGPVLHSGVVVGITSFGVCGSDRIPMVNARVSSYTNWIVAVAS